MRRRLLCSLILRPPRKGLPLTCKQGSGALPELQTCLATPDPVLAIPIMALVSSAGRLKHSVQV
jgi:hypothetical protein